MRTMSFLMPALSMLRTIGSLSKRDAMGNVVECGCVVAIIRLCCWLNWLASDHLVMVNRVNNPAPLEVKASVNHVIIAVVDEINEEQEQQPSPMPRLPPMMTSEMVKGGHPARPTIE